ncbi:MAG: hypothetical protein CMA63_06950 [Euryarchaeota archaeon]|nr:hypothetical protein [Euryarchaeota archaeon]|tara:strand:- start:9921 stop:10745 length:825 start_codon:yes stop_codon:yes gene_type:complete
MILETLLVFVGIIAIAFVFAPLGLGGGMLFVPLLHYGLGWEIDGFLFAVSLSLTGVVSWGSGLTHRSEHLVDDEVLKKGLQGAIPGAIFGVGIVLALGDGLETAFKLLSIAMIVWAVYKTVQSERKMSEHSRQDDDILHPGIQLPHLQIGTGLGGMLSSVLAIGAGVIYVPVLRTFGDLEPRKAIGTSLNVMMAVVPVAIVTHLIVLPSAMWDQFIAEFLLVLIFMAATLVGSRYGAKYGIKNLDERSIMMVFTGIMVVIGIRYLFDVTSLVLS